MDQWCEDLIKEEFNESCNFDVDDAVDKLEKLGIVARVCLITPTSSPILKYDKNEFSIIDTMDTLYHLAIHQYCMMCFDILKTFFCVWSGFNWTVLLCWAKTRKRDHRNHD